MPSSEQLPRIPEWTPKTNRKSFSRWSISRIWVIGLRNWVKESRKGYLEGGVPPIDTAIYREDDEQNPPKNGEKSWNVAGSVHKYPQSIQSEMIPWKPSGTAIEKSSRIQECRPCHLPSAWRTQRRFTIEAGARGKHEGEAGKKRIHLAEKMERKWTLWNNGRFHSLPACYFSTVKQLPDDHAMTAAATAAFQLLICITGLPIC